LINGGRASYDTVNPATGAAARFDWTFPSQTQCLQCHTRATGRVIGLTTAQLNRSHTYRGTGITDNQLRTFNHIGLLATDIGSESQYGVLPNPSDVTATLERRAKAYLETNCSICHRPDGPTPIDMYLEFATPLANMGIVGVTATSPTQPGAARVVAGDHVSSELWRRATSTGATRMPPLGVSMVDEEGLKLLAEWIDAIR
jgi:mono/diheme cytochrome c family protein